MLDIDRGSRAKATGARHSQAAIAPKQLETPWLMVDISWLSLELHPLI
jgi:hypothetical protein